MNKQYERTAAVLGDEAVEKLKKAKAAVFGLGGVGGYVCEALARSGIGTLIIVDNDEIDETNINRQIIALHSTKGRSKADVMEERLKDIDPEINIIKKKCFYLPENSDEVDLAGSSYVVDAVDTVTAKVEIITQAKKLGIPVISCMGTGNKTDPSQLRVADIAKTSVCPLAKTMRKLLRERDIKDVKTVYSTEAPVKKKSIEGNHRAPGSTAFVPPSAGLLIAAEVVKDIINDEEDL